MVRKYKTRVAAERFIRRLERAWPLHRFEALPHPEPGFFGWGIRVTTFGKASAPTKGVRAWVGKGPSPRRDVLDLGVNI